MDYGYNFLHGMKVSSQQGQRVVACGAIVLNIARMLPLPMSFISICESIVSSVSTISSKICVEVGLWCSCHASEDACSCSLACKERTCACLKYIKPLVTIAVGGVDIDVGLLVNLKRFLEENCIASLC